MMSVPHSNKNKDSSLSFFHDLGRVVDEKRMSLIENVTPCEQYATSQEQNLAKKENAVLSRQG